MTRLLPVSGRKMCKILEKLVLIKYIRLEAMHGISIQTDEELLCLCMGMKNSVLESLKRY